jgi:hypothetical protein
LQQAIALTTRIATPDSSGRHTFVPTVERLWVSLGIPNCERPSFEILRLILAA